MVVRNLLEEAVKLDRNLPLPLRPELLSRRPSTSQDQSSQAGRQREFPRCRIPEPGLWDQGGFLPASQSDGATSFRSGPWHVALSGILLSAARASYAGHRKAGQTAASDSLLPFFIKWLSSV